MNLSARNGHDLLPPALNLLFTLGVCRQSRNGAVLKMEKPVLLCVERPRERVVFWSERDANPFFHLMEALGYLAGRRDLKFYTQYLPRMKDFSDDGVSLDASYGFRWRLHFGQDQLRPIINALRKDHNDRRQVLSMWDGRVDLHNQSSKKDVPCNTQCYFSVNAGALDLTICNRSNDLVWGLLGANLVHFSFLLEYVAAWANIPMGRMFTMTNNLHGYLSTVEPLRDLVKRSGESSPYEIGLVNASRISYHPKDMEGFDRDLMNLDGGRYESTFFKEVVRPVETAHRLYRDGNLEAAVSWAKQIGAQDWQTACVTWLERRIHRREEKKRAADDGVKH